MALITIASGTARGGNYPERIAIYIGVEMISQDITNNRGTYRIRAWLKNNTTWTPWNTWPGNNAYYLKVNGNTIKSGTQFVDFRKSSTHVIADETITRDHDSNGNLSFSIEARQAIDDITTFSYAYLKGTYNAPQIKRASKVTASNVNVDVAIPIKITPEQSGVLHDIAVKYGSTTIKTLTAQGTPTSITLTAGEWTKLYNLTKTVGSFNLDIVVTTKLNGSVIGTNSARSIITYPSSVIPTLGSVTVSDSNATVPAVVGAGNFVQLLSKLRVIMNSVAGVKGSTISEYELIINGTNHGTISKDFTPATSGAYAVTARVKDSRGRWSSRKTLNFNVIAYEKPKISGYSAIRTNSAGTTDQLGTYSKHTGTLSVKSIVIGTEKNQLRYKIDKVVSGTATNILATVTHTSTLKKISHVLGTYSIDAAHVFRVTAYDKFNQTAIANFTLPTSRVPFTLSKTGASIGGIFENSDSSVAQIYGDLNIKDGGKLRLNGTNFNVSNPLSIYNSQSGHIIHTGIAASVSAVFLYLEITGNSYESMVPIDSIVQGYWYRSATWFNVAQLNKGFNLSAVKMMILNNEVVIWVPYNAAAYSTFRFQLYWSRDMTPANFWVQGGAEPAGTPKVTATVKQPASSNADTLDGYHASSFELVQSRGGDYLNGWENLPNGLRRCWKTYATTISETAMTATGPAGAYKSGWITPGNWPVAFTAAPRQQASLSVTGTAWTWLGSMKAPTATAAGEFLIYKFAQSSSAIKLFIEAVGPR